MSDLDRIIEQGLTGLLIAPVLVLIITVCKCWRQPWTSIPIGGAIAAVIVILIIEQSLGRPMSNSESWQAFAGGFTLGAIFGAFHMQYRKDKGKSLKQWATTFDTTGTDPADEAMTISDYIVVGVEVESGRDARWIIEAASEANARVKAERRGLEVTDIAKSRKKQ